MVDLVELAYELLRENKDILLSSLGIGFITAGIGIYCGRKEYEKKRDMILGGFKGEFVKNENPYSSC